jgi:hypothetical protein
MWVTAEMMADLYNQDAYSTPGRTGSNRAIQQTHRAL